MKVKQLEADNYTFYIDDNYLVKCTELELYMHTHVILVQLCIC